jgi:hypothetical protein
MPKTKQNSPHPHIAPQYGAKTQFAEKADTSPPLGKEETKFIQAAAGTLLYYAQAVDSTILTALSAIATKQAKPTEKTLAKVKQELLDYCTTQEEPIVTYHASKMILAIHSDAGYCNETNSRSRAGGHFFLSDDVDNPPNNGAILTLATIIKAVMSSAAEAELGALYLNAKEAVYLRQILTELGHPNHEHRSRRIIRQQRVSSTIKYNPNEQRQWTCASTGCAAAKHRDNSEYIGGRGRPTSRTILRNTTPPCTMSTSGQNFLAKLKISQKLEDRERN